MSCSMILKKITNMNNCDCLLPIFPCLYSFNSDDIIMKQHSNEIDRQIAKDKEDYIKTHRLLLLGAGESGKSTIIKQMQLIHVNSFSDNERKQKSYDIRNNLLDAIISLLTAMQTLIPKIQLENDENRKYSNWILINGRKNNFDFPVEFYKYTEILWHDKGVKSVFERSNEFQLIDNAKYFLDRINIIKQDNYLPTDQDILRCRVLTTGIYELMFQVNNVKFLMTDVGGQRNERRKWFLCFNDVTAIIFITACSSYDMVLREDEKKNRLVESLELFKVIWNNRWLGHISVILFLNKQDIFSKKILSGRSKLENYFSHYEQFEIPKEAIFQNESPELVKAKYFIKNEFEKLTYEGGKCKTYQHHQCYAHFTCAIDTDNIKKVFDDCRDSIQRKYLEEYELI